jgi:hypothetical protein
MHFLFKTDRNLLFMRPHLLDAALFMGNLLLAAFICRRFYAFVGARQAFFDFVSGARLLAKRGSDRAAASLLHDRSGLSSVLAGNAARQEKSPARPWVFVLPKGRQRQTIVLEAVLHPVQGYDLGHPRVLWRGLVSVGHLVLSCSRKWLAGSGSFATHSQASPISVLPQHSAPVDNASVL